MMKKIKTKKTKKQSVNWKKAFAKAEKEHIKYCKLYWGLHKKEGHKIGWIFALCCLWLSSLLMFGALSVPSVNEVALCESKLSTYFGEYDFYKVEQISQGADELCKGYYSEKGEIRDGLEVVDMGEEESTKYFKLINQTDIDYVKSNDSLFAWWLSVLGCIALGLFVLKETYRWEF